jgi:hypothetical protein
MAENELPQSRNFKDRKGGLVFFGILQVLLGVFSILILGLSILGLVVTRISGTAAGQAMNLKMMLPSFVMYAVGAVVFIWLGIGSITAKRWARSLTLVLSIVWLAVGVLTFGFEAYLMPKLLKGMQVEGRQMSESSMAIATFFILGFNFFLFIVLPAAFTLFFRSPHVKATCEQRDPKQRWTDRRPLPVLALSLMLYAGAASMMFMIAYPALPFLGTLLTGLPLIAYSVIVSAVLLYLAKSIYDLKVTAWTITLLLSLLGSATGTITFLKMDMIEYYKALGYSDLAITQMRLAEIWQIIDTRTITVPLMIIWLAVWIGYLLYVRRFFIAVPQARSGGTIP